MQRSSRLYRQALDVSTTNHNRVHGGDRNEDIIGRGWNLSRAPIGRCVPVGRHAHPLHVEARRWRILDRDVTRRIRVIRLGCLIDILCDIGDGLESQLRRERHRLHLLATELLDRERPTGRKRRDGEGQVGMSRQPRGSVQHPNTQGRRTRSQDAGVLDVDQELGGGQVHDHAPAVRDYRERADDQVRSVDRQGAPATYAVTRRLNLRGAKPDGRGQPRGINRCNVRVGRRPGDRGGRVGDTKAVEDFGRELGLQSEAVQPSTRGRHDHGRYGRQHLDRHLICLGAGSSNDLCDASRHSRYGRGGALPGHRSG